MTGYRTCIFDLYGTLVDIHTDENAPQVWEALAAHYSARGAVYRPKELRDAYFRAVAEAEGSAPLRGGRAAVPGAVDGLYPPLPGGEGAPAHPAGPGAGGVPPLQRPGPLYPDGAG